MKTTDNPVFNSEKGFWLAPPPECRCGDGFRGAYTRKTAYAITELRKREGRPSKRYRCKNGTAYHILRSEKEEKESWRSLGLDEQ